MTLPGLESKQFQNFVFVALLLFLGISLIGQISSFFMKTDTLEQKVDKLQLQQSLINSSTWVAVIMLFFLMMSIDARRS